MKNLIKLCKVSLIAVGLTTLLTGCYLNEQVGANEVGLQLSSGAIKTVVSAGRYSGGVWESLEVINTTALKLTWVDSDVWTKDKQVVTFEVGLEFSRARDTESIKYMWENYNMEARSDDALRELVLLRIPRLVKQVTTTYTLDEMLGISDSSKNRETLQSEIFTLLEAELSTCGVRLTDTGVNNIVVDEVYEAKLKEKATAQIEVELSAEKTRQLNEQLKQEEAQTKLDLEIAKRNNLIAEEGAKVYTLSPEAFELERLKLLKEVIGDSSKIYFVPEGADLSLYLTGSAAEVDGKVVQTTPTE